MRNLDPAGCKDRGKIALQAQGKLAGIFIRAYADQTGDMIPCGSPRSMVEANIWKVESEEVTPVGSRRQCRPHNSRLDLTSMVWCAAQWARDETPANDHTGHSH